jgi:hypothetical protein
MQRLHPRARPDANAEQAGAIRRWIDQQERARRKLRGQRAIEDRQVSFGSIGCARFDHLQAHEGHRLQRATQADRRSPNQHHVARRAARRKRRGGVVRGSASRRSKRASRL